VENSTKSSTATHAYAVESVVNAARILLMLRDTAELQVGAVAERLGVAKSTAHRLLATLVSQGLLHQEGSRRAYTAGQALIEVGAKVVGGLDLRDRTRPILERLTEITGETTHLLVLNDTEVMFVDGVESSHTIRAATRIGARESAHVSAAGKALLAELSLEELHRRYPEEQLAGGTDAALRTRAELELALEEVRTLGYAVNRSESESDLTAVSMVLRDGAGVAVGAVSVSGPAGRVAHRIPSIASSIRDLLPGRPSA